MSALEKYALAQRLETLAEQIEDDVEWFANLELDDSDLVDLLKEAATTIRDET